ncbi:glycosyltransferase [Candidatus Woesearchaeota archaeon]|nr:glycosyltransferase [Candidatus Woesearchaeota archaeon]
MEKGLLMLMKNMRNKKKLASLEGFHKIYSGMQEIFDELFDYTIITSYEKDTIQYKNKIFIPKNILSSSFCYYPGLYRYLKNNNFDILHIRPYYRPYSLTALFYSILNKKKIFITEEQRNDPHNTFENIIFQIYLFFLRPLINIKVHKVISLTKPSYEYLKKKGFKKLVCIPITYEPKISTKEVNNKQQKLKIICVARFEWLKAHHILIKAINHIIKNNKLAKKDIEVNLVGEGILMKDMEKLCKKLNISDIINFKGKIQNKRLDNYYQKHNIFVLSSVSDPIGMVVFEAMSNGLPAIVSSNTGAKGSVHDDKNGYVFKNKDYKDLAEKILLMKNPNKRQKFGEESIKILKENHNPGKIKNKYRDALEE